MYGIHAVSAILKHHPERILDIWLLKGRTDQKLSALQQQAQSIGLTPQWMNRKAMDDKAESTQHQGILIRVQPPKIATEHDLSQLLDEVDEPFLLILDGVTDPHNLGACLRNADAAGVHAVIVPKDNSVNLTPAVCKVASGAAETIPLIQVTNLARTMRDLQERSIWLFGAAGEAEKTLYQANFTGGMALVMGAEGHGLRRLTREHCDLLISIPMSGHVSSLNVSVATGVCLFEAVRQRQAKD